MKKLIWLCFITLVFAACEKASNTVVDMPSFEIDCSEAGCNTSLNGSTAIVIVTKSGCGSSAGFDSVATGSTVVSCTTSGCSGTVTSWADANSSPVTEIISGRHDVCAHIDSVANLTQDAGEMASETSVTINSGTTKTISSWSVSN